MIINAKNSRLVSLSKLNSYDYNKLSEYFQHLSVETKKHFGPHLFDKVAIIDFYKNNAIHHGYVAQDIETGKIIAYSIIKTGYLEHDFIRLQSYSILPNHKTDCTFAPSVTDEWQSFGIGNGLFQFILHELKVTGIKRIILWGGVQADNQKAINYYCKNGFTTLGEFEYNGLNYDMMLDIA